MPRRKVITGREILPDPRYKSKVLAKMISRMMEDGKRSTSTKIVYAALEQLSKKSGKDAIEVFTTALENVKPMVEVKSRRVGGSTYQVPVEVRDSRREALAMRWIISASRSRSGRSMSDKLSAELFDASNSTGVAFKKKEDTHRMAEANKAFSHYKW